MDENSFIIPCLDDLCKEKKEEEEEEERLCIVMRDDEGRANQKLENLCTT